MKFKNILIVLILVNTFAIPTISASGSNNSCTNNTNLVINSTPDVVPGNGGQDYVSEVWFSFYNSNTNYPHSYAADIAIYDWNGKHVEDVPGDEMDPNPAPQKATGIVDGTYTYVLDGIHKGSFNVNHNIKNEVVIDLAAFDNCASNNEIIETEPSVLERIASSLENIATNLSILISELFN